MTLKSCSGNFCWRSVEDVCQKKSSWFSIRHLSSIPPPIASIPFHTSRRLNDVHLHGALWFLSFGKKRRTRPPVPPKNCKDSKLVLRVGEVASTLTMWPDTIRTGYCLAFFYAWALCTTYNGCWERGGTPIDCSMGIIPEKGALVFRATYKGLLAPCRRTFAGVGRHHGTQSRGRIN